jgi:cytochrome c oxidase subunit 3
MSAAVFEPTWAAAGGQTKTRALDTGLWVFIGVASALFALFLTAYVMRMDSGDWSTLALPPQLWLSTALLLASSVLLQSASAATRLSTRSDGRWLLLPAGGACGLAFLAVQAWGWQALLAANVTLTANPAASFFYLLTALHGMHVLGGLVAWAATMRSLGRPLDSAHAARLVALCARYWHFLLAVWAVLFAALGWLSPEVIRFICGRG